MNQESNTNTNTTNSPNKNLVLAVAVIAILFIGFALWFLLGKKGTETESTEKKTSNKTEAPATTTPSGLEETGVSLSTEYKNSLGNYTGTWNDPTYNLFNKKMTGSLTESGNGDLAITLNLFGLTFGLADPQTVSANLKADGTVILVSSTTLVSGIKGSFDPNTGKFDIKVSSPILGEDAISFDGSISKNGVFSGTAVVTPAGGGELNMTLDK